MHKPTDNISVITAQRRETATVNILPWVIAGAILSGAAFLISVLEIAVIALK